MSGPSWHPWRTAKWWTPLEAAYLCCGKPPVSDHERRVTKTAHGADIEAMVRRLKAEVPDSMFEVSPEGLRSVRRTAVEAFAKQNGFRFPWEASAASPPSSETSSEALLKQIGVLALALAKKSDRYRRGGKPNASAIAEAAQAILAELPDANTRGLSSRSVRESIRVGLRLLAADGTTAKNSSPFLSD